MSDSLVIIPTYNERENIVRICEAVMALAVPFHILVVDDNSPDGTQKLVEEVSARYPGKIHLLKRPGKQGLGRAYLAGFAWALERNYQYICEMDADFSHPPADLIRLREVCVQGAQMAVGSRYVRGGSVKDWDTMRIALSYSASLYVRAVLWMPVADTTAGFVCYRREALQAIDLDAVSFVGYAFQIEMKYRIFRKGLKIVEVPIAFADRQEGQSKMSGNIVKEALIGVLKMKVSI